MIRAFAAAVLLGVPVTARADQFDPIVNGARVLYYGIYDVADRTVRIPYELARPIIVRAALKRWVRGLPLADSVRSRVLARIAAPDLVDEVVPFLLSLKEIYAADEDAVSTFDAHIRRTWTPTDRVAGLEHSMFAWKTESPDDGKPGFELDSEMTARIVTLYDALYLAGAQDGRGSEALLSCERSGRAVDLRAAVARASPIVRDLLLDLRARLELDEEIDHAVGATIDDPARLETVTTTGIEFVDHLVCASYRVFANQILREVQLRDWMLRQLDLPDGGGLFDYLRFANDERRYAVLVVVDGLQGHLVEALASGHGDDPFLKAVRSQHERVERFAPPTQRSSVAPAVQNRFLESLTGTRFDDYRYLPFFRDLYSDHGRRDRRRPWGIARVGLATTPTISVRNLPMVKTGAAVGGQGGTGIPNFHFVDRRFQRPGEAPEAASGRPYYFFGNDAMRLEPLTREAGMRSLFDRLPRLSSFSCAAQYDARAHFRIDALVNLALGETMRDFAETLCMTELRERARNERRLSKLRTRLLDKRDVLFRELSFWRIGAIIDRRDERVLAERAIAEIARLEQRSMPELLLYYNPWPDHFAHFKGPFSDEIVSPSGELSRLDYWLGRLGDSYRRAGIESRTLFAMAGDHGLAPIFHLLNPEVEVFDALREQGIDFRVAKISSDEGEGPRLNSLFDPPAMRGYDVVVASTAGGNYMLDFFVDQDGGWQRQPRHADLTRLRLLSRSAETIDVIGELVSRLSESLDYLVVRETDCDVEGGVVRVIGSRETPDGPRRADAFIARRGDRIFYRFENADLLDLGTLTPYENLSDEERREHARLLERCTTTAKREAPESWCREDEWRLLTSYTSRPDSVAQLAHLYDVERSGTVNLFPREGIGYNTRVPGRHAGESFAEKDAFVGVWGPPVARNAAAGRIRTLLNGSLAGVVYEFLTGEPPVQGQDGWGFPVVGEDLLH